MRTTSILALVSALYAVAGEGAGTDTVMDGNKAVHLSKSDNKMIEDLMAFTSFSREQVLTHALNICHAQGWTMHQTLQEGEDEIKNSEAPAEPANDEVSAKLNEILAAHTDANGDLDLDSLSDEELANLLFGFDGDDEDGLDDDRD